MEPEFSFPWLIVVPLSSHGLPEVDGVRKEKERLTAVKSILVYFRKMLLAVRPFLSGACATGSQKTEFLEDTFIARENAGNYFLRVVRPAFAMKIFLTGTSFFTRRRASRNCRREIRSSFKPWPAAPGSRASSREPGFFDRSYILLQ